MNLNGLGLRSRRGSTTPPWWAPLQRRGTGIARIHAGLRRRLARWIYPEGRGCACAKAVPSPRTADLLRLAEAFVRHHGFAELTQPAMLKVFYEWVGYKKYKWPVLPPPSFYRRRAASETLKRLLKHPSVCPRPATYDRVIQVFSNDWPADLPWPPDIPRPAPQLPTRETQA